MDISTYMFIMLENEKHIHPQKPHFTSEPLGLLELSISPVKRIVSSTFKSAVGYRDVGLKVCSFESQVNLCLYKYVCKRNKSRFSNELEVGKLLRAVHFV